MSSRFIKSQCHRCRCVRELRYYRWRDEYLCDECVDELAEAAVQQELRRKSED